MNFEQQYTSPDSSSFHSRELAHQPQPPKVCKDINLHTYSWESHSYGFIPWKQNSILLCLWLHRQRPDPETGQKWGVKMDGRSWEKYMSWPGAIDSHPSYSTAARQCYLAIFRWHLRQSFPTGKMGFFCSENMLVKHSCQFISCSWCRKML